MGLPAPSFGFSLSFAVAGSALNVVPRTKGEVPSEGLSTLALGGGKAVSVSMETSGALDVKAPPGLDPKMLDPPEAPPREAKPPLLAKFANPAVAGAVVPLPKTFPVFSPELENPDWPNAGAAPLVEPDAQGETFCPKPSVWPNAGAAGLLPRLGVPKAGAAGAAAAGLAPNELTPKAGAVDVPAAVDQGDALAPRTDAPPKAGVGADGEPNAGVLLAKDPNAEGVEVAGAGVAKAAEVASPAAMPGYVVPDRIDSL
jgi:hypothetical protein